MQFKVDENLHPDAADVLRDAGRDAMTVLEQNLRGRADREIAEVCLREQRAIITLDLDFSDIREFPPEHYQGIIVLRLVDQSRPAVVRTMRRLLAVMAVERLPGALWIVDEQQVRIRTQTAETPGG
jgi:predicted nuclease of predicted toxin-antitoxin system